MCCHLLASIGDCVVCPGVKSGSVTPRLFPLDTAICAGHITILVFFFIIRNINSKYRGGSQVITLEYSLDVLCRKWLQIAVTSTPGLLLLTVKQCFHQHPLTNADLQDSHPQLLGVCGWLSKCHRATQPPWGNCQ